MTQLPVTVIGGYLGAGKTTLINRVLAQANGMRLMVLVNDFGAINIDAGLLTSASEDTLELTNGCICCTMGTDLFETVARILDRKPRPDHVIIEASGIADPARIANFAAADPDLRYAGIVTVIDGEGFADVVKDERIAPQVLKQIEVADLLLVSKSLSKESGASLAAVGIEANHTTKDVDHVFQFFLQELDFQIMAESTVVHPTYVHWTDTDLPPLDQSDIVGRLANLPSGLMRLKAIIPALKSGVWEIHVVGARGDFAYHSETRPSAIVAIGLAADMDPEAVKRWWESSQN